MVPQADGGFVDPGLRYQSAVVLPVFSTMQNALVVKFYAALQTWRRPGVEPAEMADIVAATLAAAGRTALPAPAYMCEEDTRRQAAEMRVLQRVDVGPVRVISTQHFPSNSSVQPLRRRRWRMRG